MAPRKTASEEPKTATVDTSNAEQVDFYLKNSFRRQPGIYSDDEERKAAEVVRAEVEGREPDLDNAPAIAGTPLVTQDVLVETALSSGLPTNDLLSIVSEIEPHQTLPVFVQETPPAEVNVYVPAEETAAPVEVYSSDDADSESK